MHKFQLKAELKLCVVREKVIQTMGYSIDFDTMPFSLIPMKLRNNTRIKEQNVTHYKTYSFTTLYVRRHRSLLLLHLMLC